MLVYLHVYVLICYSITNIGGNKNLADIKSGEGEYNVWWEEKPELGRNKS